ncbi:hypothetical protein PPYR_04767 [Photinus pyralis]|uniref:Reverse transcriptase domain-containing protein n=1 Tax=Photinus pyralis TaxID=7054 RepID=A0A5N4AZ03_PHOPY|nr:hypothetical protein PPYR_04767 [Photinus pyralis]
MFADDTSYLFSGDSMSEVVENAQSSVNSVVQWINSNKLVLNASKSLIINFNLREIIRKESLLVKTSRKSIPQEKCTKFLGIYLDSNLKWNTHIDSLSKSLASSAYAIFKLKSFSSDKVLLSFYYAHFYSKVKYGILFWGRSNLTHRIFLIQKQVVRSIVGVKKRTSCRNIFRQLGLLPVPAIYILEILMFVKENPKEFSVNNYNHSYNTRRGKDFCIPAHRLSMSENNPRYMGSLLFNKLPERFKSETRHKQFKFQVMHFLLSQCYYSVEEYLSDSCT